VIFIRIRSRFGYDLNTVTVMVTVYDSRLVLISVLVLVYEAKTNLEPVRVVHPL